jgi:A/G-specific adenine glycosylase
MNRSGRPQAAGRPPPEDLAFLRRALLDHYDRTRRDLPWRGETDPYRIWVSEVMLQQTRAETVTEYYRRWLERFPDLETLAAAELDDVLLSWQGLGYYRRARNLHAGALVVRERHAGTVPGTYEALRELPGVGAYTAGAVASIAFGEAVPAVDGNARRVLARLRDRAAPAPKWLRETAAALVDPARPGEWNQALMELGATVCTPRSPRCDVCPVSAWCAARAAGTQEERPAPSARRPVPRERYATAVVVDAGGRALVARRPEGGLLGGMWSFPDTALEAGAEGDENALVASARKAARTAGAQLSPGPPVALLEPVRHRFTHLDATYQPVVLAGSGADGENRRWVVLEAPVAVALPAAQRKIARAAAAALGRL